MTSVIYFECAFFKARNKRPDVTSMEVPPNLVTTVLYNLDRSPYAVVALPRRTLTLYLIVVYGAL
jgi:hypothetical protein